MKLNLSGTTLIQQLILQIVTGLIVAANPGIVKAQLTPDNTVGSTTRSDTVKGLNSDIIEGGASRGTNLFHSFTNFNVDAGRGVYFSNPADINNILTRVTGSSQSNIFGTLGVLGNANLFLINPNGISFGPNAQLDVKGSFVASTADRIIFDNYQFTTTNPTAPPLLTVNIPVGLGFRNNPGDITVKDSNLSGSGLGVPQDKILWLNAGSGKVIFDNGGILSRGSQVILEGGDVSLTNNAFIDVSASGGGSITINSGDLTMENSRLIAGIDALSGSANAQAGDIKINNSRLFTLHNSSVSNNVGFLGTGYAGQINIKAYEINISGSGGALIESTVLSGGTGYAGDIRIETSNLIVDGGFISTDAYNDNSNTFGIAGNIGIYSSNDVTVKNGGWISSDVFSDSGQNDGGLIFIQTNTLNLENGGVISTSTYGQGSAGYIKINATDSINISGYAKDENNKPIFDRSFPLTYDNQGNVIYSENKLVSSRIESEVKTDATGDGGFIDISTSKLTLEDGGVISTSTYGQGSAGYIDINATDGINISGYAKGENNKPISDSNVIYDNQGNVIYSENKLASSSSRIESNVESGAEGNAGNIKIDLNAGSLSLTDGGLINASTNGIGNAGNIDIKASNITIDDQGFLSSLVYEGGEGKGGNIKIETSNLTLKNGGGIITDTRANGDAGDITFKITDNLKLTNSTISSSTTPDSTGKAGNINIDPTLIELDGSQITVNSQGSGDGGNITLIGKNLNLNNSTISASTKSGQGGDITLNIPDTIRQNNSKIEASAGENGNGGNVTIKTKFIIGNGGNISANATQGRGGKIDIEAKGSFGYNGYRKDEPKKPKIDASSETGVNGVVEIYSGGEDPSQGLIDLPENLLTATIITNSCRQGQSSQNSNSLIVKGRGGLALTSDQLPSSSEVEVSLIAPTSVKSSSAINSTSANMEKTAFKTIIPAQGWEINSQGDVVLVGHSTGNPAERVNTAITCASN